MFTQRTIRSLSIAARRSSGGVLRAFSRSTVVAIKQMPPRPTIDEGDIEEAFLKGSGPGGQKINKTSSAAQLKHLPTGMVIKSQATRSRSQNRKIARRLLAEKLEVIEKGPESRVAMKGEIKKKKKASKSKKAKRKYRALGEDGDAELEGETSGHVVDGTQSKEKILEEIHQTVEKVERSRAPSDSEGQDHQGR